MSVQKRGVSLSDSTSHMNEGSSFRSLNTEMSGDNSVGAIGPIFEPSAQQVGLKDSHTADSEHSFGWTTLHDDISNSFYSIDKTYSPYFKVT